MTITNLSHFASQHPTIEHLTPSSPSFNKVRTIFVSPDVKPSAILRPSDIEDTAAVVSFLTANKIPFTIRVGGHDMHGRSMQNDVVTLDLRRIKQVAIDKKTMTARVGGGILIADLVAALQEEGLITPVGTVAGVGYVGWAMYGGYGPYSSLYGLGVDQIVGAKVIDARGKLIEADKELLKGIRGAGGAFGVIVEVTVRVYKLDQILAGAIMFQSDSLDTVLRQYNEGYRSLALSGSGLPAPLAIMQAVLPLPTPTFAMFFSWASSDFETGKEWLDKISALAPATVNTVQPSTPSAFLAEISGFVAPLTQGRMFSISLKKITDEVAGVIAKYTADIPADPHMLFDAHELRSNSPSTKPNSGSDSVFSAREPHYMIEICTIVEKQENLEKALAWGREFQEALKETDAGNILQASYLSFLPRDEFEHEKIFGENLPFLRGLKGRLDPGNVFQNAISYL
ncbi:FAD-binding oxidoreductase [Aspergillus undulatus]|uniref:FAD-binding oxidoreductase n=1 Tax=Aspergillus undulatus TaxID=1810928 RepID=UPI003CCD4CC2